jgi:5'-nucleotidase
VTETLSRAPNYAGESPLGDIIADAQLAATSSAANGGAVIAFTNPGGVRTDITRKEDGAVTYADLFASQPFRNQLVTLTLTGKQIKDMLEQQWRDPKRPRILQVSKGFGYAWDGSKGDGERVPPERMSLNGQTIDPAANYRVTVNNFLSVGGDSFTARLFRGEQPDRPDRRRSHRQDQLREISRIMPFPSGHRKPRLATSHPRNRHDPASHAFRLSRPSHASGTPRAA